MLGLVAGRRAGLATTSVVASESATAKLRRVLPDALAHRLGALLDTAEFTLGGQPANTPETTVLLTIAEAVRERRAVAISYSSTGQQRGERIVRPYGIVAHSARWYVIGPDSNADATRIFRLDRISTVQLLDGTFDVPEGFDAAAEVLSRLAQAPYRYQILLRVNGPVDDVRKRFPPVIASVQDGDQQGWTRVRINAERLDWVPAVLAGLRLPFVIDQPDALRDLVRSLAAQLAAAADPGA